MVSVVFRSLCLSFFQTLTYKSTCYVVQCFLYRATDTLPFRLYRRLKVFGLAAAQATVACWADFPYRSRLPVRHCFFLYLSQLWFVVSVFVATSAFYVAGFLAQRRTLRLSHSRLGTRQWRTLQDSVVDEGAEIRLLQFMGEQTLEWRSPPYCNCVDFQKHL